MPETGRRRRCRSSGGWASASWFRRWERVRVIPENVKVRPLGGAPAQEVVQGGFHHSPDAQAVHVPHGEVLDPQALQEVARKQEARGGDAAQVMLATPSCPDQRTRLTVLRGPRLAGRCRPDPWRTGPASPRRILGYLVPEEGGSGGHTPLRRPRPPPGGGASPSPAAPSAGTTPAGRGGSPMARSPACSGPRGRRPR